MSVEKIIYDLIDHARANVAGTIAALVILFYILVRRTKLFFILLSMVAIVFGMLIIFERLSGIGLGK